MRQYHHRPLKANHIRLIKLQPSCRTGRLALVEQVSLVVADGTYEALLYAWGDSTSTPCRLLCGDGSFLPITLNLYQALLSLRKEKETRLLWVDAVCIYQDDLTEKSEQVLLMSQIYAKAKVATVYLGEEGKEKNTVKKKAGQKRSTRKTMGAVLTAFMIRVPVRQSPSISSMRSS